MNPTLQYCLISFACFWIYFGISLPIAIIIGRGMRRLGGQP